jgi:hypothetical protein
MAADFPALIARHRDCFLSGKTRPVEWRAGAPALVRDRPRRKKESPMSLHRCVVFVSLAFAALPHPPAHAADAAPSDLVLARPGTLPIIITAPHGGRQAIPGVAPRDTLGRPRGGRGYVTGGDTNTDILALGIAAEIKALTGKEPYLVMAKFKRKFIDPNRPPEIAVDSPVARPYYDYYHQSVRRFVDEISSKYRPAC